MWKGKPNCVCEELEWLSNYGGHVERLRSTKPAVRFAVPTRPFTLSHNAKRDATKLRNLIRLNDRMIGRDTEIHDENMKLLNRILQIDTAGLSHKSTGHVRSVSLNRDFRRKTEKRICTENQSFLSRLQNVHSVYNNSKWTHDYRKHLMLKQNISKVRGTHECGRTCDRQHADEEDQQRDLLQQKTGDGGGGETVGQDVEPDQYGGRPGRIRLPLLRHQLHHRAQDEAAVGPGAHHLLAHVIGLSSITVF